jgi:hypothetical protein
MSLTFNNNIESISSSGFKSEIQKIAVEGNNVYIVWVRFNNSNSNYSIYFKKSQDGGNNFLDSILIASGGSNQISELDIIVNGQYIHIIWNRTNTGTDPEKNQIVYSRSTNSGASFNNIVIANYATNGLEQNMSLLNDTIAIVWSETIAGTTRFAIKYIVSTDNGATFSNKVSLSNESQSARDAKIKINNNYVHVIWASSNGTNTIIQYIKSTQGSRTSFDNLVNISVNSSSSFLPVIDLSGSNVYISWMRDISGLMRIEFNNSNDNGASFGAVKQLSSGANQNTNVLRLKSIGNYVYVLSQRSNMGGNNGRIDFISSSDNGANFGAVKLLSEDGQEANDPEMAAIGSYIYVVFKRSDGSNDRVQFVSSNDGGNNFSSATTLSLVNKTGDSPQVAANSGNTKIHVCWLLEMGVGETLVKYNYAFFNSVASACFLKDTIIKTDSGNVKIQDIQADKNSINGKKVKALTKTFYAKKGDNIPPFLISIPKDALFKNSPDKETFVSPLHSVFYNGQLIFAKDLVLMDKASPVNYNYKDHVYDILLDTHEKMVANNMIVETLDPESITGRFYRHFVINKKASSEEKALAKTILYEFNNFYWNECLNYPKINPEKKQEFDEAVYKKFLLTCQTSEKKKIFKSLV